MTRRFINNFVAPNGTTLEAYDPLWIPDIDWSANANTVASLIRSNTLRRPASQTVVNNRNTFYNTTLNSFATNPNDYEAVTDFSYIGSASNNTIQNTGVIARANSTTNNGYFARYRANAGYQLFRQTAAASTQLGATSALDLNPSALSFASPMRRRIRLRVVGSTISVFRDTYDNATQQWTEGVTPIITATDTNHATGQAGLWHGSVANDADTPNDGFIINEWYVEDLVTANATAPTNLTPSNITGSSFTLSWTAPNLNGGALTNYVVEKADKGGTNWVEVGTPTATTLANITLDANGNDFRVRAITSTDRVGDNSTILAVDPVIVLVVGSFTFSDVTNNSVTLNWTAPSSGTVLNYIIQSSTLSGDFNTIQNDWVAIAGSPFSASTFTTSATLTANRGNAFRIIPVSASGNGQETIVKVSIPDRVTTITPGNITQTTISLSWAIPLSSVTPFNFVIERASVGGANWTAIAGSPFASTVNSINNVSLSAGGNDFRIRAVNVIGGLNSDTLSINTNLGAPTGLQQFSFVPGNSLALGRAYYTFADRTGEVVHLSWTAPSGGGGAPERYLIERSTDGGGTWQQVLVTSDNRTFAYNVPANPGTCQFRIIARNQIGDSPPSSMLSLTATTARCLGQLLHRDGIWTWFTHPVAQRYENDTYIGWVDSRGVVGVTKTNNDSKLSSSFDLRNLAAILSGVIIAGRAEIDDHNNAAIWIREDGRIACFYGAHNDPAGIRIRVSEHPRDISSFTAEIQDNPTNGTQVTLPTCYSNPRYLKDAGQVLYHFRTGSPPNAPHALVTYNTRLDPAQTASYSPGLSQIRSDDAAYTGQRPYVHSVVNGTNRIDFAYTDGHPNEISTSIYHMYAIWDSVTRTFKYYRSNGQEIVNPNALTTPSLPVRPKISGGGSDATLVYDGTAMRSWILDIKIGFDGNPRVIFARYSNGSGSWAASAAGNSDHRFMFSRWTGSAWTTPVDIIGANVATVSQSRTVDGVSVDLTGPGLVESGKNGARSGTSGNEWQYTGGSCFDAMNPNIIYASVPVNNVREIQEWRTNDNGETWVKTRDITQNTRPGIINARPYSPYNHDGKIAVVWWRGSYGDWISFYNTNVWGAPSSDVTITAPSNLVPLGAKFALSRAGQMISLGF